MKQERLYSLDLLRGLDIFLLTVCGRLIWTAYEVWHIPVEKLAQFQHAYGGFTFWDIIMPLFLFMCGAAVPLALPKRLDEKGCPTVAFWKHVFGRVALLWVLGMICQGHLLTFDRLQISPYTNTLQAIAAGYLIAALALLVRSSRLRFALPFVLMAVYGGILAIYGRYEQSDNAAINVEMWILHRILPAESKAFAWVGGYSWFLTTLAFGAMTLWGMQVTDILRGIRTPGRKALTLGGYGVGLLALGLVLEYVVGEPCIKHIYTCSFTCQAMGYSMLALAALYVLTDIWKFRRGLGVFVLFGQFALWAYMIGGVFRPGLLGFAKVLCQGVPHLVGTDAYLAFVEQVVACVLLAGALSLRRRLKAAAVPRVK